MSELKNKLPLLVSLWSLWFMIFVLRMSIKSILPVLKTQFSSSHSQIGFAVAALIIGYSVMQIPSGYLSDMVKKRNVIIPGILLSSIGLMLASFSKSLLSLVSLLFLTGLGLGTYYPAGMGLITEWFSRDARGKAIGFHETASSAGSIIGPLTAGLLVTLYGWEIGFKVFSVSILSTIPLIYFFGKEKNEVINENSFNWINDVRPLLPLIIIFTLIASSWMGFTTYLTSYLTNIGFSEGLAGGMFSIMPAISLISMPVAGHFSDKIRRKKLIMILLLVSSPFIYLISYIESFILINVFLVIIGSTMFASYPVVVTYISDKIPNEITGSGFGVVNALGMGISALASPAVGYVIDIYNYKIAFLAISSLILISIFIISFEKEPEVQSKE